MYLIRSFFKRILDDLRQKKLIPLKILCFVHASTQLVLYPYLTIHMRELGINVEETAIMSSLTPLFLIMIPPLAGLFADKIGNFRLLLALTSSMGGLSALLLLLVPVGRYTITYPPAVEFIATCDDAVLHLQDVSQYSCTPHLYPRENNMIVHTCGFICESSNDSSSINSVVSSNSYIVNLHSKEQSQRFIYRNVKSISEDSQDRKRPRLMKNNPNFNSTMTQVSDSKIFFPTPQLYTMNCIVGNNHSTCSLGNFDLNSDMEKKTIKDYTVKIMHRVDDDIETPMYWVNNIHNGSSSLEIGGDYSTNCIDTFKQPGNNNDIVVQVGSERFSKCYSACAMTTHRKSLCTNSQQQSDIDPAFTFWSYMAIRVLIGIISGTSFALFEGAVIAIIREQRADYGMQKVYGSFGGIISSPLSGLFIDYASRGKGYTDFRPAFYMYAVLKVLSGILVLGLDLDFKRPAKTLVKDVITVFRNFEIVALLIVCVVMGIAWGYLESFLFWFLQDLGASQSLMGITITVGGVAGLPLLVLSGPIISRIGHSNVLFIGFIFYAIRLFGYSLIYNPWLSLIFEAMESVTSALSFTAAVTYAALLSSTTTDSSVQGLLGGLYYGVGKGAGSLIGGYLMKFYGTRSTYRLFAAAVLVTGCLYFVFNRFFIRKFVKCRENDISAKSAASIVGSSAITHTKVIKDVAAETKTSEMAQLDHLKLVKDNTDGSSDAGVDNPAYLDNEFCNDSKKNLEKCINFH